MYLFLIEIIDEEVIKENVYADQYKPDPIGEPVVDWEDYPGKPKECAHATFRVAGGDPNTVFRCIHLQEGIVYDKPIVDLIFNRINK